jgi:hypothetical protein
MKTNLLLALNTIGFVWVIVMNTLANTLPLNGYTTGELSALYPNRFVPAGFTFSVWGIIYLALLGFVIFQFTQRGKPMVQAIGIWFFLSCLANGGWIIAWHYRLPVLSLGIMAFLLYSLVQVYLLVQGFNWSGHWLGRLPFQLYLGWITVAIVANSTAVLVDAGWSGGTLPEVTWAAIMAGVAVLAGLAFLLKFGDIPYVLVILWALYGIYSRQVQMAGDLPTAPLNMTILIGGGVLAAGIIWKGIQKVLG